MRYLQISPSCLAAGRCASAQSKFDWRQVLDSWTVERLSSESGSSDAGCNAVVWRVHAWACPTNPRKNWTLTILGFFLLLRGGAGAQSWSIQCPFPATAGRARQQLIVLASKDKQSCCCCQQPYGHQYGCIRCTPTLRECWNCLHLPAIFTSQW
jgi:hypothetical protein